MSMEPPREPSGPEQCIVWPEIAEAVFRFCNGKVLATALQVCRSWHKQARRALESRRQWVSYMSVMDTVEACLDELATVVEYVPFFPAAALVFSSFPSAQSMGKVKKKLSRLLPKTCHLIGAYSNGVMGMISGRTRSEQENVPGVTIILAPRIPSVYFSAFCMSTGPPDDCSTDADQRCCVTAESGEELDDMGLPRHAVDDVRCVVVLGKRPDSVLIANKIKECYGTNVAIVGAFSARFSRGKSPLLISGPACSGLSSRKQPMDAVCLVMAGRLHCATKCIGRGFQWPPSSGNLVDLTSKNVSARGLETAAAIFSCCGLGVNYFEQENFETQQLQKAFPHVPIIGMFGNGEISSHGESTCHLGPESSKGTASPVVVAEFVHTYSSVFCLWSLLRPT